MKVGFTYPFSGVLYFRSMYLQLGFQNLHLITPGIDVPRYAMASAFLHHNDMEALQCAQSAQLFFSKGETDKNSSVVMLFISSWVISENGFMFSVCFPVLFGRFFGA